MNKIISVFTLVLLLILFIFTQWAYSDLSRKKTRKGIESYEQEQWDESSQYFQDALLDDPENPTGHFNIGSSQYKRKNYEESLKSYEKAMTTQDINLKQKSYYNLGNTYYQMNKYQESIQSYIKALDLDPNDVDAKYNLELVRAKLKEMAQKQPMQNQAQQQQQQGDQQNRGGNENNNENQEQQEDQQKGEQQQEKQQQQEQQQSQVQKAENKKELSKEEAERILQALKSEEKENQKLRRAKQSSQKVRVEKDW